MKKPEVEIGAVYEVKISNRLVRVKINCLSIYGGWVGINLDTRRSVRVKNAARLRRKLT